MASTGHICLFAWVLGIRTPVLMLTHHVLYQLSHLLPWLALFPFTAPLMSWCIIIFVYDALPYSGMSIPREQGHCHIRSRVWSREHSLIRFLFEIRGALPCEEVYARLSILYSFLSHVLSVTNPDGTTPSASGHLPTECTCIPLIFTEPLLCASCWPVSVANERQQASGTFI